MKLLLACLMAGSLLGTPRASAKLDIRQEQIHFEQATSRAAITDKIKGGQTVESQLRAGGGQSMLEVGSQSRGKTVAEAGKKVRISSMTETLPELWLFFGRLNAGVKAGTIRSTEQLIERCQEFYTAERMAEIEAIVPGWKHMASFEHGKTLWHINEAMVALLQLDEYRSMSPSQQTVQQWVVFLHDVAKEPVDGRDSRHGFRSAARAGRIMPKLGFPVTTAYPVEFQDWFNLTDTATRFDAAQDLEIHDNGKLPGILSAAKRIFAEPTRTAVSAIALHQSITSLAAWPVKAPLTNDQVLAYVDEDLFPVLLALTLADSGGWNLFDSPTLQSMYKETRAAFRDLPRAPISRKPRVNR
jgi:hypothetical protein